MCCGIHRLTNGSVCRQYKEPYLQKGAVSCHQAFPKAQWQQWSLDTKGSSGSRDLQGWLRVGCAQLPMQGSAVQDQALGTQHGHRELLHPPWVLSAAWTQLQGREGLDWWLKGSDLQQGLLEKSRTGQKCRRVGKELPHSILTPCFVPSL